ncbi:MAG: iron ABC transporter permease [Acidobacteria bacterium]|nr:iron ABC transporter permease [Acidobacteriota bacterium]
MKSVRWGTMAPVSVRSFLALLAALAALLGLAVLLAAGTGSVSITPSQFARILAGDRSNPELYDIVWAVRLPRIFLSAVVGAALAVAGAVFQSLLRNPLAEPFVLGVSSGASFGAIASSLLLWYGWIGAANMVYLKPGAAFLGALATIAIVYTMAGAQRGVASNRLLLAGIVISSFLYSMNIFLLTFLRQAEVQNVFFWIIGDLSQPARGVWVIVAAVLAGFSFLLYHAPELNLLAVSEQDAEALGVSVGRIKILVYFSASLMTGVVVSVSGTIGYVGLLVPHMVRFVVGSDHRRVLPACLFGGAVFTIFADTVARTLMSPMELPVGVVTAVVGAPFFIYLLHRRSR